MRCKCVTTSGHNQGAAAAEADAVGEQRWSKRNRGVFLLWTIQGLHFLLDDGSGQSFLSEHAVGLSSTSENLSGISEGECWVPVSEGKSLGWYIRVLCNYFEECINGSRGVALLCTRYSLTYGVYATCIMNLVTTESTRQLIGVMTVEMSCWKFLHTCRYMCCCSVAVNSFPC